MNKDQVKGYVIKLLKDENKSNEEIQYMIDKLDKLMSEIKKDQAAGYYYDLDEWCK